jgi:membrane protease subunit HflC
LDGETRKAVANVNLIEVVRSQNRDFTVSVDTISDEQQKTSAEIKLGREGIVQEILSRASAVTAEFGIELVDIRFKRLNYVEDVQRSVYDRMISEREKIRDKLRSEGQGRSAEIRGTKEKELKRITSEAYRSAQEISGAADSTASKVYADAFGRDPEFYAYLKTLETYDTAISEDETLVLSTDGDFYKFLKGSGGR